MFTGISEAICKEAWEGLLPTIAALAATGRFDKFEGTIVVVDPRPIDRPRQDHEQDVFNDAVIFTAFVGGEEAVKFTKVALSKAFISWKTGLPSSVVQQQHPYLYGVGDTFWGGSTVTAGGLIVSFSGVQQVHDEAISEMMASLIRSICRDEVTKDGGLIDSWSRTSSSFILDEPVETVQIIKTGKNRLLFTCPLPEGLEQAVQPSLLVDDWEKFTDHGGAGFEVEINTHSPDGDARNELSVRAVIDLVWTGLYERGSVATPVAPKIALAAPEG